MCKTQCPSSGARGQQQGDTKWVLTIPFVHKQEIRVEGSVVDWREQGAHTGSRQARETADNFRGIQGQDEERGVRRSLWKEAVWLALLGLERVAPTGSSFYKFVPQNVALFFKVMEPLGGEGT